ncbi:hypothetical protein B9J07_25420 [Sinorhizobium sp. LM21]|nr:ACSH domain containing protein [Sinorhizobium phage phi3LM21]OWZ90901.1 hypothetical protein B9J07_25420 [Sinorhizobium sp. LM21]
MGSSIPQFALSVRQPWAWCILHAGKDMENRTWRTRFRGSIALHAAKGLTKAEFEDCLATVHEISETQPFTPGLTMPALDELPRGGIVGVVDIVGCVNNDKSAWFFGPYGFCLANPRPVEFVPVKGELGFFDWRKNLKGSRR